MGGGVKENKMSGTEKSSLISTGSQLFLYGIVVTEEAKLEAVSILGGATTKLSLQDNNQYPLTNCQVFKKLVVAFGIYWSKNSSMTRGYC